MEASIVKSRGANEKLNVVKEESSEMPVVLDYVKQKAKMYELQQAIQNWERKVEIAKIASKSR